MHERHTNRKIYFDEQVLLVETILKPYLEKVIKLSPDSDVCEIGCGEGGNLKPFLDMGCRVTGIDISLHKIENAMHFLSGHSNIRNLSLYNADIKHINHEKTGVFDLILLRDTLEHLPDQEKIMQQIRKLLKPNGRLFIGFPPWRMPFGGHQQMCQSRWLGKTPYFHLLPLPLYKLTLKMFGESEEKINGLLEIRETRISISDFKKITRRSQFKIEREEYFLINPNYQVKFNLKPRKLPRLMNIPYLRDFFITTCYYVLSVHQSAGLFPVEGVKRIAGVE